MIIGGHGESQTGYADWDGPGDIWGLRYWVLFVCSMEGVPIGVDDCHVGIWEIGMEYVFKNILIPFAVSFTVTFLLTMFWIKLSRKEK